MRRLIIALAAVCLVLMAADAAEPEPQPYIHGPSAYLCSNGKIILRSGGKLYLKE